MCVCFEEGLRFVYIYTTNTLLLIYNLQSKSSICAYIENRSPIQTYCRLSTHMYLNIHRKCLAPSSLHRISHTQHSQHNVHSTSHLFFCSCICVQIQIQRNTNIRARIDDNNHCTILYIYMCMVHLEDFGINLCEGDEVLFYKQFTNIQRDAHYLMLARE